MISILIALLALSMFSPSATAAVVSGKSNSSPSNNSNGSKASAKAIADQTAVVKQLQDSLAKNGQLCSSFKGKDQKAMDACLTKSKEIANSLTAAATKLQALNQAMRTIKNVSTSTVNANPVVASGGGASLSDLAKANARIAQLESQISSLSSSYKTIFGTMHKQTLTWVAWLPVSWTGRNDQGDFLNLKPTLADPCSGGTLGKLIKGLTIYISDTTPNQGEMAYNCSRIVYVP